MKAIPSPLTDDCTPPFCPTHRFVGALRSCVCMLSEWVGGSQGNECAAEPLTTRTQHRPTHQQHFYSTKIIMTDVVTSQRCAEGSTYRKDRKLGDGPVKCTWFPGTTEKSPHKKLPANAEMRPKILGTVLEAIGNTPLVRLNRVGKDSTEAEILVKCEYFNAGGSVKDRIGKRMFEGAETDGWIKPGDTIIEPTSGNTGIGLALNAAVKGYKMIVTMPEKMSAEKVNVLKALGAEIVRTPNEASYDSPESHIGVANRLQKSIDSAHILDQYKNPNNPLAHYDGTAEEILWACDGKVDCFVAGAGTGGTLSGTARRLKEACPDCVIVGVDPNGSLLAEPDSLNGEFGKGYQVEGTGYDFIPTVLDREIVDFWIKTNDQESLTTGRRLVREEGMLCGMSSGANVWAAVEAAKRLNFGKGKRIVTLLPDSTRNYMTKFLLDEWMVAHGFIDDPNAPAREKWAGHTVGMLKYSLPVTVSPKVPCKKAIEILQSQGFDQLPVVDAKGGVIGVVTEGNLSSHVLSGRVGANDPCEKCLYKKFNQVSSQTTLGELATMFDNTHFALITTNQQCYGDDGESCVKTVVSGVVSRIDLMNYLSEKNLLVQ